MVRFNIRAVGIGGTEELFLKFFANSESYSTYQIYTKMEKGMAYKNVHTRVKRLLELNLITQMEVKKGAKFYKISPYGLIHYISYIITENHRFIIYNLDNPVMQYLLLQIFEKDTVNDFWNLKEFHSREIMQYLHDCCYITRNACKTIWQRINRYGVGDLLPKGDILHKYYTCLYKKLPIDELVLKEINEYQSKIKKIVSDDVTTTTTTTSNQYKELKIYYSSRFRNDSEPFLLREIYSFLLNNIAWPIEDKAESLVFNILAGLGEIVQKDDIYNQEKLEEITQYMRDFSLRKMMRDKSFFNIASEIEKDYDSGFKQLLYYHH